MRVMVNIVLMNFEVLSYHICIQTNKQMPWAYTDWSALSFQNLKKKDKTMKQQK